MRLFDLSTREHNVRQRKMRKIVNKDCLDVWVIFLSKEVLEKRLEKVEYIHNLLHFY